MRTDEDSLEAMLGLAPHLPDAISRAAVVSTGWDMLAKGELSTGEFLDCVLGVLEIERSPGIVEPFFGLALRAAEQWTPTALVPRRLSRLADVAARRAAETDHRTAALRTLAASAARPEHFELLDREAQQDVDLAWLTLTRRASLGRHDPDAVQALLERDPDPEAEIRALAVAAARPTVEAKEEAWRRIFDDRAVPAGVPLSVVARGFWRPVQHDLLVPFADRYLEQVASLQSEGMMATLSLIGAMQPTTCSDDWPDRARETAERDETDPVVRNTLLTVADTMSRVLRARS